MIHKYAEIFCWKNVSIFCSAKATHIFSAKNIRILYIESTKTVNEMTLNELVKLTTLWTTGPWLLYALAGFDKELMRLAKVITRLRVLADLILCWSSLPLWWKSIVVALIYSFSYKMFDVRIKSKQKLDVNGRNFQFSYIWINYIIIINGILAFCSTL